MNEQELQALSHQIGVEWGQAVNGLARELIKHGIGRHEAHALAVSIWAGLAGQNPPVLWEVGPTDEQGIATTLDLPGAA